MKGSAPSTKPPNPPYILVFEDGEEAAKPGALPLVIAVDDRPAVPLFDSPAKAGAFLNSVEFGVGWRSLEISAGRLLRTLELLKEEVEYIAINPPPAPSSEGAGGMRVRMGDLRALISALRQSIKEDNPLGLEGLDGPGKS